MSRFGVFLLTDGLTSSKAGIKDSNYVINNDDQADLLESILGYKLDKFKFYNPVDYFSSSSYEKVYEGTIYIPINLDELQADIASGNKIKDSEAYEEEGRAQALGLRSKFNDREY